MNVVPCSIGCPLAIALRTSVRKQRDFSPSAKRRLQEHLSLGLRNSASIIATDLSDRRSISQGLMQKESDSFVFRNEWPFWMKLQNIIRRFLHFRSISWNPPVWFDHWVSSFEFHNNRYSVLIGSNPCFLAYAVVREVHSSVWTEHVLLVIVTWRWSNILKVTINRNDLIMQRNHCLLWFLNCETLCECSDRSGKISLLHLCFRQLQSIFPPVSYWNE